jgi:2-oxoglutarate dehydrogenase E2 component (dihydrolipoamide succinyltransferase)
MSHLILVPELGESITEATVIRWLKEPGSSVEIGEILLELETDKVNLEIGADKGGVLSGIMVKDGEDVKVGDVLGTIDAGDGESGLPAKKEPDKKRTSEKKKSTPRQHQISAPKKPDPQPAMQVKTVDESTKTEPVPTTARTVDAPGRELKPAAVPPRIPSPPQDQRETRPASEETIRLSRRRRTIAERLVEAQQTAAILTTFNEIDMSRVQDIRRTRRDRFLEQHGIKLGLSSFFIKACVGALKSFPNINSELSGNDLIRKYHYDIGVAVDTGDGLVVPVIQNADRLSFAGIEKAIRDYAVRARDGELGIEDLRGGTFTITNGGMFGSMLSTPILNPPQVGILGLHNITDRPVVVDGRVEIRPMMYLALSYDHRVVDGREAVGFLVRISELIEEPEQLLLEG